MKHEFFRFLVAGGSTFVLELAVLYGLVDFAGLYYLLASALAFILAVLANYILCIRWVFFATKRQTAWMLFVFLGSSIVGLGINQLCMWWLVSCLGIHYLMAKGISAAIVLLWNYLAKRKTVQG